MKIIAEDTAIALAALTISVKPRQRHGTGATVSLCNVILFLCPNFNPNCSNKLKLIKEGLDCSGNSYSTPHTTIMGFKGSIIIRVANGHVVDAFFIYRGHA